jgi:hypothetical protein
MRKVPKEYNPDQKIIQVPQLYRFSKIFWIFLHHVAIENVSLQLHHLLVEFLFGSRDLCLVELAIVFVIVLIIGWLLRVLVVVPLLPLVSLFLPLPVTSEKGG